MYILLNFREPINFTCINVPTTAKDLKNLQQQNCYFLFTYNIHYTSL